MNNKTIGKLGEEMAAAHLVGLGYVILEQNYQYGKTGEIDIIARDGEYLVFCEVKTRNNDQFGEPECAITPRKQSQLRRLANIYLYEHQLAEQACRFDVVAIKMLKDSRELHHVKNAF